MCIIDQRLCILQKLATLKIIIQKKVTFINRFVYFSNLFVWKVLLELSLKFLNTFIRIIFLRKLFLYNSEIEGIEFIPL